MLQALPDFRRIPGLDAPCLTVQPSLATAAALAEGLSRRSFRPRVVFLVSERAFRSEEFAEEAARVAGEPLPNLFMIVASKDGFELPRRACSGWDCREAAADDFASLESACASFDFSSGGRRCSSRRHAAAPASRSSRRSLRTADIPSASASSTRRLKNWR